MPCTSRSWSGSTRRKRSSARSRTWASSGTDASSCACSGPWPPTTSSRPRNRGADVDPLTLLFRLPFLPVQGVIAIGEIIREQAERELQDPANVRRQLEEAEEARVSGEISDEDLARIEREATGRLLHRSDPK